MQCGSSRLRLPNENLPVFLIRVYTHDDTITEQPNLNPPMFFSHADSRQSAKFNSTKFSGYMVNYATQLKVK